MEKNIMNPYFSQPKSQTGNMGNKDLMTSAQLRYAQMENNVQPKAAVESTNANNYINERMASNGNTGVAGVSYTPNNMNNDNNMTSPGNDQNNQNMQMARNNMNFPYNPALANNINNLNEMIMPDSMYGKKMTGNYTQGMGMQQGMDLNDTLDQTIPKMAATPIKGMMDDAPGSVQRTRLRDVPVIEGAPPTPTEMLQVSLQEILAKNTGEFVEIEYLVGTQQLVKKSGILYNVGVSFVTLYEEKTKTFVITDFFSIKFVTVYIHGVRPTD